MKTLALVTAFPPSAGSLNEYGFHLVNALAARPDIEKIIVIADKYASGEPELNLGPKIEVRRVWRFNSPLAGLHIVRALQKSKAEGALYNLQTASFGDREIPAALGLLTPAISQKLIAPSGVIMHNLVEAVDLSKTNLANSPLRQKLVNAASYFVTKIILLSGFMTVTLDSFWDILKEKYKANNTFMVPHGSFPIDNEESIQSLEKRPRTVVTMGKFGTYKRLERTIGAIQNLNMRHGYVAEEEVAHFFTQAKLAIFDYDSTTGSSGVLHQAAIYGTPAAYPMMGDFIDVTEREGLKGFNFKSLDQNALEKTIMKCLNDTQTAQSYADNNVAISKGVFNNIRQAKNAALRIEPLSHGFITSKP